MKKIVLGKLWYRVFAKLIDLAIMFGLTFAIFFAAVYPFTFDQTSYVENLSSIGLIYDESDLYVKSSSGSYVQKSSYTSIDKVTELTYAEVYVDNEKNIINITDSLYKFYTEKLIDFDGESNYSKEVFDSSILKIGTEDSNISSFSIKNGNYEYVLIDDSKELITVNFVIEAFQNACSLVDNSKKVTSLNEENRQIMLKALVYIIPVLFGVSFIFDFLIPLFNKNCQTIGKMIFKLGLVDKDGYTLKKYWLIPRWLSYILIEIVLGFVTFLGTDLISYTMLMFNKKKRTIHDYCSNSVVIDIKNSVWFDSYREERYIMEKNSKTINL